MTDQSNLTRAEILAMTPDQLRLAVAEYVFNASWSHGDGSVGSPLDLLQFQDGAVVAYRYYSDVNYTMCVPDYPRDIAAAWTVHKLMSVQIFSKRKRYFDELHHLVSKRMSVDLLVSWPDIFAHVEPEDFSRAALITVSEAANG